MPQTHYDFDRYIKLVEAYRSVRESVLESTKMEREIRKAAQEDERLELERKKKFINDIIEIGKFLIKLCSTSLLASLVLPDEMGAAKALLLYVSLGGAVAGVIFLVLGIRFRSDIEADYISEIRKLSQSYDEELEPLVSHTEAVKDEVAVLNEMVRLEQESMIELHPELKDRLLGGNQQ